jgi:hypothetical protein
MAGNRCNIYEFIDKIKEAKSFEEAKAYLVPLLELCAYVIVQSDAAVLEDHENWRDTFAGRLREAAATQSGGNPPMPYGAPGPSPGNARVHAATGGAASGGSQKLVGGRPPKASGLGESDGRLGVRSTRPPAHQNLPHSLLSIMNGSHPSLHNDD